ncbi:CmcJ/NvfI family oxidoreductase [Haliea sp. E17]|uniref:CmcJ/NvfI family oxidoreductase n=1 Tax=Haliea sp. E17 TaxID=3401576 RepID=UPI003AABF300
MPATSVSSSLNFAADRRDGGIWSNSWRERITQQLVTEPVSLADARHLAVAPSLEKEGFEIHRMPLEGDCWEDDPWVKSVYLPSALALVAELTGAAHVAPFYHGGILIRDTGNPQRAAAAEFVHLDQTREAIGPFVDMAAEPSVQQRYPRYQVYNLWRSITPPPQDVPLALCDQRTVSEADWVIGRTVEPNFPDGVPYLSSVHNPEQRWHYFSDVDLDEVIVFKGFDSDPSQPMGCLHGAFQAPAVAPGTRPRASVELRVFAFFEA